MPTPDAVNPDAGRGAMPSFGVANVVKLALCVIGFIAAAAFFAYACVELRVDYFRLFSPTATQTLSWLVRLGIAAFLVMLTFGVMVVLVRPVAIAAGAVVAGMAVYAVVLGGGLVTWYAAGVVAIVFLILLLSVAKQLENQIDFSVRPMGDKELALSSLLAILIGVSAGMGYYRDAARGEYLVPPQIVATVRQQMNGYVKTMVEAQGVPASMKALAISTAEAQVAEMVDGYLEKLKPYSAYVPYGLGAIAYFSFQVVFFIPGFAASLALGPLLFLLRLTGFAHLSKQTRVVTRLTLAEGEGSTE
jgi:hypothetical protein